MKMWWVLSSRPPKLAAVAKPIVKSPEFITLSTLVPDEENPEVNEPPDHPPLDSAIAETAVIRSEVWPQITPDRRPHRTQWIP